MSIHLQVTAARAVCLGKALRPEFKTYGKQLRDNAHTLARTLVSKGIKLVSGGTDTLLVLLDLSGRGITG